ncbi:MAG: hypothetical protein KDD29_10125 [Flavobacteriales bacterium]|nr:hypothetical protein [Flavobacteriales bacterium]MCB9335000.1 hypothetical protein [Flavobacteriales bacterium]
MITVRLYLLLVLLSFAQASFSQVNALTEYGEEIILYENGTWKYKNRELEEVEIKTNSKSFKKSKESTFLIKSNRFNIGFYINPEDWTFKKSTTNEDAEYTLNYKDGDLYAMIITEKIEIPILTLQGIALDNARKVAPDIEIVKQEYRMVNDLKVLFMQMDGTMKGVKFTYYGYYYSNEQGTVQFVTFTSQNLLPEYRSLCDDLLNGMVILD